jgi:hypothetical protein
MAKEKAMNELNRKDFLKAAGTGSAAVAAGAGLPLAKHFIDRSGHLTFRAATGLPRAPLPSYATQIVEGQVDLTHGSGLVTSRVLAGHPGDTSLVGLPGLARVIRVTDVDSDGQQVRLRGVVEDRSQLRRGESHRVEIIVDRKHGVVKAPFLDRQLQHELTEA